MPLKELLSVVLSAVLNGRHSKNLRGNFTKAFVPMRLKASPKQVVSARLSALLNTICFFLISAVFSDLASNES
jgi:hypothetical protein